MCYEVGEYCIVHLKIMDGFYLRENEEIVFLFE